MKLGRISLSGVIYSQNAKNTRERPTEPTWKYSAECLKEVAQYAKSLGVKIDLEPVNRYETALVNTLEQALKLIDMIREDNMRIPLDTYHINIEEKSFYEATKLAGDKLIHYHLCKNDRGIPGIGLVDWGGVFRAFSEINYQGYMPLESFVDMTDNMNTWVWRQLAPSGDVLIKEGAAFILGMQKKCGLI